MYVMASQVVFRRRDGCLECEMRPKNYLNAPQLYPTSPLPTAAVYPANEWMSLTPLYAIKPQGYILSKQDCVSVPVTSNRPKSIFVFQ